MADQHHHHHHHHHQEQQQQHANDAAVVVAEEEEEDSLVGMLADIFPQHSRATLGQTIRACAGDAEAAVQLLLLYQPPSPQFPISARHTRTTSAEEQPQAAVEEEEEQQQQQQHEEEEAGDLDLSISAPFLAELPSAPTLVRVYGEHGGRCGYCNRSMTGRISWGALVGRFGRWGVACSSHPWRPLARHDGLPRED